MATLAQINANRLNAQKSTGPRSDEGKAAARFNALKHSASAQSNVLPGEDDAELASLSRAYHEQFRPCGPEEEILVEKIIAADWTQRRMDRLETAVFNAMIAQQDPEEPNPIGAAFLADCKGPNALQKLHRRREAASRDWYRAITQLRQIQYDRAFQPPPPARQGFPQASPPAPKPAAAFPHPPAQPPAPDARPERREPRPLAPGPRPLKIGFVLHESSAPAALELRPPDMRK